MNTKTLLWTPGRADEALGARRASGWNRVGEPRSATPPVAPPHLVAVPAPAADDNDTLVMPREALPFPLTKPAQPVVAPLARGGAAQVNGLVVSAYKVVGFAVLGTILFGLASFLFTTLYYTLSSSWMTPMVLSPSDPRVLQLNSQYASEKAARDGVATQRLELAARLEDARRTVASEEAFQASFDEAMRADLADRDAELAGFERLLADLRRTRREVTSASRDFAAVSRGELEQQAAARLIDRDQEVKGGYELGQIAAANLGLHEKNAELDARIATLRRAVSSLRSARGDRRAMSYDVLHMQHERDLSVLASRKAADEGDALGKSLEMVDRTVADYDAQLARIEKAPYLTAADRSVSTGFVPYDNVGHLGVGDAVFSCAASVFWCKRIGRVEEVLGGEVIGRDPLHDRELRGVLVRLKLDDGSAVQKAVLHLKRAPFGV